VHLNFFSLHSPPLQPYAAGKKSSPYTPFLQKKGSLQKHRMHLLTPRFGATDFGGDDTIAKKGFFEFFESVILKRPQMRVREN
jgi:hypothetical protein